MKQLRLYINCLCGIILALTFSISYAIEQRDKNSVKRNFHLYDESCTAEENSCEPELDLPEIIKRGKLVALVGYSPNSYFVYRGTPMGFEYEMLQMLAKELKVDLEIVLVHNYNELTDKLQKGEGDIIANNLIVTKEHDAFVDFTDGIMTTRQVLVQRKNQPSRINYIKASTLIRSPLDLINQKVHVRKGTAFHVRLKNLSEEIGGDICIVEEEGESGTEELIRLVSEGKIPMTVADEITARFQKDHYHNIDIETGISFEQKVAWAVRESSPLLRAKVNGWLKKVKENKSFDRLYKKYYIDRKGANESKGCTRLASCGRKISAYDDLIMYYARQIGWDWRLLASLIYQESHFNPTAKSWAGASGLMQLMPATAEAFGASNTEDPVESLQAGTKYLKWLEKYWAKKVPDREERLKFILASYNVGQEHVADAQRLAEKYNKDPYKWDDNVAYYLLQKSEEQYCKDPVVKYGYCRGKEPFEYVNKVLSRYEHYRKLIREEIHAQGTGTESDGKS